MDMSINGKKIDMWEGYLYDLDMSAPCPHQWEELALFTSVYRKCRLCGEERDAES